MTTRPRLSREAEFANPRRELPLPRSDWDEACRWWATPYGSWRYAAETEAMRRFPQFAPSFSREGLLYWQGWLESGLTPGRRYVVRVTYPPSFPDEAPDVAIVNPRLPRDVPHVLSRQRPCLYDPANGDGYDPARTTAATLVAWTALWIHAFETWLATDEWPGAEDWDGDPLSLG